jgi:hypothetical protein
MLHKSRVWGEPVETDLDTFAKQVTTRDWTVCTAWKVGDYVFVNDASSGDGAQEYAVLIEDEDGQWFQVESWTCSWMTPDRVRELYAKLPESDWRKPVQPRFARHGYGTPLGPMSCCA